MISYYADVANKLEMHHTVARHAAPHLHTTVECVLVTQGSIELGMEQNLYHMEEGDFAVIFPEIAHHYQVFSEGTNKIYNLQIPPTLTGSLQNQLKSLKPENPVIRKQQVHPDVKNAMESIYRIYVRNNIARQSGIPGKEGDVLPFTEELYQGYVMLILARSMGQLTLSERHLSEEAELVYQLITYISAHFREELTLEGVAHELGCSPYSVSRMFSGALHTNFNQYINERRLDLAAAELKDTESTITEIYENAGFTSQRTFNRAFKERFHMAPREFRKVSVNEETPKNNGQQ